jgi:D-alanine transaminase
MTEAIVYLNGDYKPLSQATVNVLDRGFIFGDGIYEVVPVYDGRLFRFHQHLARLDRSLAKLRIMNPHTSEEWLAISRELIRLCHERTQSRDQIVYLQVTRGVAVRDHAMPVGITPTRFAMSNPLKPPTTDQQTNGVSCISAEDFRWQRGDIKSTSLLGNVLSRQLSVDADCLETIMFRDGFLTEASASNVWIAREGQLIGVPKSGQVLEGIRYGLFEELCRLEKIPFTIRPISKDEVFSADELMLSSATKEILPVRILDGRTIGTGCPGPVQIRLYDAYQKAKRTMGI